MQSAGRVKALMIKWHMLDAAAGVLTRKLPLRNHPCGYRL